jgi:GntR family transcriptional regulator
MSRSVPLRYQLKNDLVELFRRLKLSKGDKIPTEHELIKTLDTSRSTLREGLLLLEEERIIRTKHGTGRFLLSSPNDLQIEMTRLQSVTELLSTFGIEGTIEVIDVKEEPADEHIAKQLQIEMGAPTLVVERIRKAEDIPIIYSIDIIPENFTNAAWEQDAFKGSLFRFLEEKCNIKIDYSLTTLRAPSESDRIRSLLPDNSPIHWIMLEQICYYASGEPIIYSNDYHHSDYITFQVRRFRK